MVERVERVERVEQSIAPPLATFAKVSGIKCGRRHPQCLSCPFSCDHRRGRSKIAQRNCEIAMSRRAIAHTDGWGDESKDVDKCRPSPYGWVYKCLYCPHAISHRRPTFVLRLFPWVSPVRSLRMQEILRATFFAHARKFNYMSYFF